MKLSIIVPCYNEEETIGEVLRRVLSVRLPCEVEVIVVDDGSGDDSPRIAAEFPNVHLVRHGVNKGKGVAIRTGIEESSGDLILIQDADLEYFPEDIPKLLQAILTDKADLVLGSRFLAEPKGMSRLHMSANKTLSYATRVLFGSRTTDLMTGYKLFTRKAVQDISVDSTSFNVEAELVAKLLMRRLRVVEVPIRYEYRRKGKAKITWRHGFTSLWTLLKIKFGDTWQKNGGTSWLIFIASFLGYLIFASRDHLRGDFKVLNGDEPHYLIAAKSIVQDGDLFLENNYANPLPEVEKWIWDWHVVWGSWHHAYSAHGIGLPILMAPFYMLGGVFGTKIMMCLFQSLVNVYVYKLCNRTTGSGTLSTLTSLLFGFATVLLPFSNALFPEVPMALIILVCSYFTLKPLDWRHLAMSGLLMGFAPFLKSAYLVFSPVVLTYVLHTSIVRKDLKAVIYFALPFFMMIGLIGYYQFYAFGSPFVTPQAFELGMPLTGALGLMFDRYYGLLVYAPVLYLSIFGLKSFIKRNRAIATYVSSLFLVMYVITASWVSWNGGWSYPARLIVPVIPLISLPFVYSLATYLSRIWFKFILVLTVFISFAVNTAIAWTHAYSRKLLTSIPLEMLRRITGRNVEFLLPNFNEKLGALSLVVVTVFLIATLLILYHSE